MLLHARGYTHCVYPQNRVHIAVIPLHNFILRVCFLVLFLISIALAFVAQKMEPEQRYVCKHFIREYNPCISEGYRRREKERKKANILILGFQLVTAWCEIKMIASRTILLDAL